jgi:hypothetical protein
LSFRPPGVWQSRTRGDFNSSNKTSLISLQYLLPHKGATQRLLHRFTNDG